MATVRDLIGDIQRDLRRDNITPSEMAGHLARLSSLYGNVLQEERESELAFKHVLLKSFETEGKSNRATILAETSPEYSRFREAHDFAKLTLELMRSLKQAMRSIADEMRAMS